MDIPEIDRAHHRLVDLMAQLERESLAGASRTVLSRTFLALGEATQKHFAEEEAMMQRIGYPVDPEVFNFLSFWLRSHICGVDQRYAERARAHSGR
jgi:hemerythrin